MCEADGEALPIYKIPHSCLTAEYSRFMEGEKHGAVEAKESRTIRAERRACQLSAVLYSVGLTISPSSSARM